MKRRFVPTPINPRGYAVLMLVAGRWILHGYHRTKASAEETFNALPRSTSPDRWYWYGTKAHAAEMLSR